METKKYKNYQNRVRQELTGNILPFWHQWSVDDARGGFHGRMTNDLHVPDNAPKGVILNARILWTFSAVLDGPFAGFLETGFGSNLAMQ